MTYEYKVSNKKSGITVVCNSSFKHDGEDVQVEAQFHCSNPDKPLDSIKRTLNNQIRKTIKEYKLNIKLVEN